MTEDEDVERLLERIADEGITAEEACRERPELMPAVQRGLRAMRAMRDEIDALFPERGQVATPPAGDGALPSIPGHVVEAVLGWGGMGVVYKARHLGLDRLVALKMMLTGRFASGHERLRFQREAELAGRLEHPNTAPVRILPMTRRVSVSTT